MGKRISQIALFKQTYVVDQLKDKVLTQECEIENLKSQIEELKRLIEGTQIN